MVSYVGIYLGEHWNAKSSQKPKKTRGATRREVGTADMKCVP
jgi:hypothetical protein